MPYSAVSVTVSPVVSNLVELSTAWLLAESDPVDWSEQVAVVVEAIDFLLSFDAFAALDIVDGVAGGSVFDEMHLDAFGSCVGYNYYHSENILISVQILPKHYNSCAKFTLKV